MAASSIVFRIASNVIVRTITKIVLKILLGLDRVASHLKFKALVRRSGKSVCHYTVEIKYGENITIGNHTRIGPHSSIGAKSPIIIGDYVVVSRGVLIETAGLDMAKAPPYKHNSKPITIQNGVWIAANVVILGGVTIGENAVIGAGVIVSKDVPAGAIVVGQPFRLLERKIQR